MIKPPARILVLSIFILLGSLAAGEAGPIEPRTISPEQFHAMAIAAEELKGRGLDLFRYKITFWDEEETIVVLFTDRNFPPELEAQMRGSPPKPWAPSFGVEVSRIDFSVLKASFQR